MYKFTTLIQIGLKEDGNTALTRQLYGPWAFFFSIKGANDQMPQRERESEDTANHYVLGDLNYKNYCN